MDKLDKTDKTKENKIPAGMPVSMAMLQAATFLPGGRTESTLSKEKIPGIQMVWMRNEGLLVKLGAFEAIIPDTNIKIAHFEPKTG